MPVALEAIHFNHDSKSATTGAFSIRRNERCDIVVPEWQRDMSLRPEDAPAAYAYESVKKLKEITIKAEFSCDAADPPKFLRALDGHGYRGNVLGTAVSKEVKLERGKWVATLVLSNVRILELGVSVNDVIWNWQYSDDGENWVHFATTFHRIYVVVNMPNDPWQPASRDFANTQLPWTEVLDFACRAAAGITHVDDAATKITQWTNSLGSGFVRYDDEDGWTGFTFDDPARFDCSEFLLLLNGGKNLQGPSVNCDDCAAVVTSFSNILGCKLREGDMGKASFTLKPHLRIGHTKAQEGRFSRHNVAWLRDGKETDPLFDACVRLDFQKGPGETWIVPTNIPFKKYRPFLSGDGDNCVPLGNLTIRIIGLSFPGMRSGAPETFADVESSDPVSRSATISDVATISSTLSHAADQFQNLKLTDFRLVHTTLSKYLLQVFCRRKKERDVSFGIDIYECDSLNAIRTLVKKILGRFNLPPEKKEIPSFGTETYASDHWFLILFVRNSFVFLIRNTGRRKVSCEDLAKKIDEVASKLEGIS